ncbi:CDGSH iron-sulfur domain-containing protein [Dyella humicola]|uniref:CDGSH iron-sulfur domain-containing protein n=1 Tax=Dyella humicola TaxID=2992126 RepID=UPI00225406E2|nr:CDGSH iron-sulfur domain-containing protein [Dyella humicola]
MAPASANIQVTVSKNGPYLVVGDIALAKQTVVADADGGSEAWKEGPPIDHPPTYALCRCGRSQSKPFCDGSHKKVGFDGTETADRRPYLDQARVVNGPVDDLADAETLCAFARFCDPNGNVWSQVVETDNAQARAQFIRQVNQCPSGRLVAWDRATGRPVESALPISIGLLEDPVEACSGPLWLRGGIPVVAADGFQYEVRNRVTLCRCGESKNKPFCDGSHAAIHFKDY